MSFFLLSFLLVSLLFSLANAGQLQNSHRRRAAVKYTGDSQCAKYLCISARSNGTTVEYVVQSTGVQKQVGWISIGFGDVMYNSPMVVIWGNTDGSFTLSERLGKDHVMPVVWKPQHKSTLLSSETDVTGDKPKWSFSRAATTTGTQHLIWAISANAPSSDSASAPIQQHLTDGFGNFLLDFSKTVPAPSSAPAGGASSTGSATKTGSKITTLVHPTGGSSSASSSSSSSAAPSASQSGSAVKSSHVGVLSAVIGFVMLVKVL